MRKKRGQKNYRKPGKFLFPRRKRTEDETDWFLLEARVSPVKSRLQRRSGVNWAIRILAVACLCISAPIGIKAGYDAIFFENEEFVLQRLNVHTDGVLRSHQVTEVANVVVGMQLMELDLKNIRSRIEKLPVVEEAIVSREMPDKLNVVIKERVPVAWVSCPPLGVRPGDMERGFLIDASGIIFRCLDLTNEVAQLPVIETFSMPEPVEGKELEVEGFASALQLLAAAEKSVSTVSDQIQMIRLRNEWSIHCHYRSGLQVVFDIYDIERGLQDLAAILDQMEKAGATLATVNVVARENIPVTFATPVDPQRFVEEEASLQANAEEVGASPFNEKEKHLRSILNGG